MTTVTLTDVVFTADGSLEAKWSDGSGMQFDSLTHLRENLAAVDSDVLLTKKLCLAYTLARSADLSNINSTRNKSFIFDLSVASPIKVQ